MPFKVAIVSRDAEVRMAAARAFERAPADWIVELHEDEPSDADAIVRGSDLPAGRGPTFDPARPDEALDALLTPAARTGARICAVVGSAGGVGATAVALHLAAEWGPRTCYAEVGGLGGAAWFGLPDDARTWLPRDDDLASSALPVSGGFRLLRAPEPDPGPEAFPLGAARSSFDRLVLDAGAGWTFDGDPVGVLVTTPTRPAARAAGAVLAAHPGVRWAVVVNRVGPGGQIMRAGVEELLGRPVALELPCCPALRDAEDEARLLTSSWHRWRRGIARLARAIEAC